MENRYKIMIGTGIGKKLYEGSRHADYSYYRKRFLPVLEREGYGVTLINCTEIG
jgi:hypothetical protein